MINQGPLDELLSTAGEKRWDMFDQLLKQGRCINEIDPETGRTLVSLIAQQPRSYSIVVELLKRGADRNKALEGAVLGKQIGMMNWLIETGADINIAAYTATWCNNETLREELVGRGASKEWVRKGAARANNIRLREKLLKEHYASQSNLFGASLSGDAERAGRLFAEFAGVSPVELQSENFLSGDSTRRMMNALCGMSLDFFRSLPKTIKDLFPAYQFALGGHADQVLQLIADVVDIHSAVLGAAIGGHTQLVNSLLLKGAKPENAIQGYGFRGLQRRVFELLTSQGESQKLLNHSVFGAAAGGHPELVNDLLTRGAALSEAIKGATEYGHTEFAQRLSATKQPMNDEELDSFLDDFDPEPDQERSPTICRKN